MDVNVILFDKFTSLDFIGPVEALQRIDEYEIRYLSENGGRISNDEGLVIDTDSIKSIIPWILLVPGGFGTRQLVDDLSFIADLKKVAEESKFCLTVCTGAALLAKTGLLDGRKATSNKFAFQWVESVNPAVEWQSHARWVVDGKYYSSSGVSAEIDMALGFVRDQYGEEKAKIIAERMEYIWNSDSSLDPFAADM